MLFYNQFLKLFTIALLMFLYPFQRAESRNLFTGVTQTQPIAQGTTEEAWQLYQQGIEHYQNNQAQQAIETLNRAIEKFREVGDRSGEETSLYFIGLVYELSLQQHDRAEEFYQEALAIAKEIGDRDRELKNLETLGRLYSQLAEHDRAARVYEQALAIAKEMGDRDREQHFLNTLSQVYLNLGQEERSEQFFQEALVIPTESGDRQAQADLLYQQGAEKYASIQFTESLQLFERSLGIYQELGNRERESAVLEFISSVYSEVGDFTQAIDYMKKALKVAKENGLTTHSLLQNLGLLYLVAEDFDLALDYMEQSLAAIESSSLENEMSRNLYIMSNLNLQGQLHLKVGNYAKAVEVCDLLLERAKKAENVNVDFALSGSMSCLGEAYTQLKNYEKAIQFHEQVLLIHDNNISKFATLPEVVDIYQMMKASTMVAIADTYASWGDSTQSLNYIENSLKIVRNLESSRSAKTLSIIPLKRSILNRISSILVHLKRFPEAENILQEAVELHEFERKKLSSNRNSTNSLGISDRLNISKFDTQIYTYRTLQKVLIAQNKSDRALEIADRARARAFVELLAQRFTAGDEQQVIPLTLPEIQRIAKEKNATIVEYSLIDDEFTIEGNTESREAELYIWVIKPTGKITFRQSDLKPLWQQQNTSLDTIIAKARCFSNNACRSNITVAERSGSTPQVRSDNTSLFNWQVAQEQMSATSYPQQQNQELQQLHQLLIDPIADLLPTNISDRTIFIPQDSLFLVPFPALQDANGTYLIEKHTILTAPSIQVLDLTRQHKNRTNAGAKGNRGEVLIVGNPTMPSISVGVGQPPQPLSPLPGAEQEAREIGQLLNVTPLIGNDATESTVVQKMPSARIIHFATHGTFDPDRGIGSWIALAPDAVTPPHSSVARGSAIDDGLLTAEEIFNLTLNADLVALSACNTGRGKITGDGVIGLSRSFISAGVSSVLVSLWKVPDDATYLLMREFYQNWQRSGDKAQALRQAMLTTMQQYPSPDNWAAFTLIGEAE